MSYTIAVAGKGGTGKSTLAALAIKYITRELLRPVLAVDADSNSTLGMMLGVHPRGTIADIRDDVVNGRAETTPGSSKERHIEYCIHQSITEAGGFDLLTMGRPEGPKCYCYVNNLLRKYLDRASADYPFVVIDNGAGMEHLSRRTTNNVDLLFVVAEPTAAGVASAVRIFELVERLEVTIRRTALVLNRVPPEGIDTVVLDRLAFAELKPETCIRRDPVLEEAGIDGTSLLDIDEGNPSYRAIAGFVAGHVARSTGPRSDIHTEETVYAGS